MPRSRSRSMLSRNCALRSRSLSAPVASSSRSASVDLPWSMWAMIEKLRMRLVGVGMNVQVGRQRRRGQCRRSAPRRYREWQLPGEVVPFLVEHEVYPLPNVLSHRDARLRIEKLELLVLLGRDVDGRGNFLPRHDMTMHDHRSTVKDVGGFLRSADLMNRAFRPTVAAMLMSRTRMLLVVSAAALGRVRIDAQEGRDGVAGAERAALAAGRPRQVQRQGQTRRHGRHRRGQEARLWKFFKTIDVGGQKTEVITCKQVDLNHDGKIDMVMYYDDGGSQIVLEEFDRDFDGKFDFTAYYNQNKRVRDEIDMNFDRASTSGSTTRKASWSASSRTGTTTARSTSGSTTRAASSIASATTPAARAGSTSGTARPRSRKKRPAATRPRPEQPLRAASRRPAARPHRRPPPPPAPGAAAPAAKPAPPRREAAGTAKK